MDFGWVIAVFVVLMVLALAYTMYGRRQNQTGISKHPIEDRQGASGVGGESGDDIGAADRDTKEDHPSTMGTKP